MKKTHIKTAIDKLFDIITFDEDDIYQIVINPATNEMDADDSHKYLVVEIAFLVEGKIYDRSYSLRVK